VDDDDPSIPIPLDGYSQRGGGRSVAYFVVFLLLVAGGIFAQQRYGYGSSLWQRYGPPLRERYSLLVQKLHGEDAGQVAVNTPNQNPPQNAVVGSDPAAATSSDGGQSANPPVAPDASTPPAPPASNAESSSASEHVVTPTTAESQAADARSRKPHSRRQMMMLNRAAAAEAAAAAAEEASSAGGEAPINVAPAVMEANLVASRVPAYPEVAKAEHIEGPVVVQAVISKDGTVDRVHVIEGDRLLRDAASEAVRRWRYKPYLLNGKPVEVATTVTVDFKLNR
jgi:TonB family protein